MKSAVVTGASSGIGRACTLMLLESGYRVYGIARNFFKTGIEHDSFIPCTCDLTDRRAIEAVSADIRSSTGKKLELLLNCAGTGSFAPHEEISLDSIHELVALNLEAPLLLTSIFLRDIRKSRGFIINISSIAAMHPSPRGCAYGATKAGLLHFSRSLFEETRRSGVKAVCIIPDMTRTAFFDRLDFSPGHAPDAYLEPECIARSVKEVLSQREGTVITEVVIRPQKRVIDRRPAAGRSA